LSSQAFVPSGCFTSVIFPKGFPSVALSPLALLSLFWTPLGRYHLRLHQCSARFLHPLHTLICQRHMTAHHKIFPHEKVVRNYTWP
jgi:hypothetical protein